jgi:hypothetical protein
LFAFRKHERRTAFRTSDFKVWHRGFSTESELEDFTLLLFGALALRFFQPQGRGAKALFSQTHAEKPWRPDGLLA